MLHQSNNVVVRVGGVVLKVGTQADRIRREVDVAFHAGRSGGPALEPLAAPILSGPFAVSSWPYLASDPRPAGDVAAGKALVALQRSLADIPVTLPALGDRLREVRGLLDDHVATAALGSAGRVLLRKAVDLIAVDAESSDAAVVLHGEPHDGNRLTVHGNIVYLDLEAACTGPLEWDLAYLPEHVVEEVWPYHNRPLRRRLRAGVSACVSTYCWRHVTSRPEDAEMRWHAEHHLEAVREVLPSP